MSVLAIIFVGVLAGVLIYRNTSIGQAKVVFREFPCASMAKPDKVVRLNGFTFYVYVPLSHEGFLNMSIAERAKYFPCYTLTYCLKLENEYLDEHPDIKGRVYSALEILCRLRMNSSEKGWSDLNYGIYDPETSAIYIGVPKTMNKSLLSNIIVKLQKIALEYDVNIYLYNIACSQNEYKEAFGNISAKELWEKLKEIDVDDESAEGYDWMTGRGEFLINMSITDPNDPRIMDTLQKITQLYTPNTPCKEVSVVFIRYYSK